MKTEQPPLIRLSEYQAPELTIGSVDLRFSLSPKMTTVQANLAISRGQAGDLTLDGEELLLQNVSIDGQQLDGHEYQHTATSLTLLNAPAAFTLSTEVSIDPILNTRLEGLYQSNGIYCTQCEAEGFRRITFFPDRPDVMATYRVTIHAENEAAPILLSNGNLVSHRDLSDGWHETVWEDPFPKPSYLFALVAGRLDCLEDTFTTASGRTVDLKIWVEPGKAERATYAMDALKRSMRWDEERFGLEYDLDIFNIVAVSDFNMGAMENKSLNVFNAKYILADPETATDADYANIESIVAHEYFHNWTGNRVTCRDWFQLSLKEGLTVFRDQEFSADMRSRAVTRIQDVRMLRARQFPEDAGPLAHPVRPESYMEINNFYTATVYEKGAEVIRMQHSMLGEDGFQAGMKLYFDRHDGQAVTCDDFVAAMADANGADMTAFKTWYSQAGTPEVTATWQQEGPTFTLTLSQVTSPTPGQVEKSPLPIPIALGLLDATAGDDIIPTQVITLTKAQDSFSFDVGAASVIPSLNRGFSAPIILKDTLSAKDRAFLMAHDSDPFARWEAGQRYATDLLLTQISDLTNGKGAAPQPEFISAFSQTLMDETADPAFRALTLTLPSEDFLAEQIRPVPIDEIHKARASLRQEIGAELYSDFMDIYSAMTLSGAYRPDAADAGRRALRNTALAYLCASGDADAATLAFSHYNDADNMTDRMAAISLLTDMDSPARDEALGHFHDRYQDDEQVMDKWLSVQAMSRRDDTLQQIQSLMDHPAFSMKKPNKVRALIGAFAMGNPLRFHDASGEGYAFVRDRLIELDKLNPQVAARLLGVFGQWQRLQADRGRLMRTALEAIAQTPGLSRDCTEIANKSLSE